MIIEQRVRDSDLFQQRLAEMETCLKILTHWKSDRTT